MSELELVALLKRLAKITDNGLGEALRALTFVGEGYGCYVNFDVRPDAIPWPDDYHLSFIQYNGLIEDQDLDDLFGASNGYRYHVDSLIVDVFWLWDGDGILFFRLREGDETLTEIISHDCKHSDGWTEKIMVWPENVQSQFVIQNIKQPHMGH